MITPDFEASPVMQRLVAASAHRVRVRPLDRKRFDAEIALLRDIFNDAWAENWGFVPFTAAEFHELGRNLRFLVDPELIQIAEVDGEAAAFMVVIPNINEAIRELRGRLFPTGWAKLLWRLKVRYPSTARVPLMGVRRRFQRTRIGPALAFLVIAACRPPTQRRGVKEVELSWILEDNAGMRSIIESIGGRAYKRYRVYERQLDDAAEPHVQRHRAGRRSRPGRPGRGRGRGRGQVPDAHRREPDGRSRRARAGAKRAREHDPALRPAGGSAARDRRNCARMVSDGGVRWMSPRGHARHQRRRRAGRAARGRAGAADHRRSRAADVPTWCGISSTRRARWAATSPSRWRRTSWCSEPIRARAGPC